MAEGTPDSSRIIKLIMDNPKLVEEIGEMIKSDKTPSESEEVTVDSTPKAPEVPTMTAPEGAKSRNRRELLFALTPYLSEKRSQAIDSMLSMAEVFTMLKR